MIGYCEKCGCLMGSTCPYSKLPNTFCGPCYWDLRKGDLIICADATNGAHTLRVGQLYEVDSIQRDSNRVMLFTTGVAIGWPWYQFRFVTRRTGIWPWSGKNGAAGDGVG
jgi:hypothetical protein